VHIPPEIRRPRYGLRNTTRESHGKIRVIVFNVLCRYIVILTLKRRMLYSQEQIAHPKGYLHKKVCARSEQRVCRRRVRGRGRVREGRKRVRRMGYGRNRY
jgi:hypothetical protein